MLTFTSTIRSVPSRRDRSMRGYCPHSVQNRYLQGPQQCDHSALRQHPLLGLEDLKPFPRQQLPPPNPPTPPGCHRRASPHPFSGCTVMARGLSKPWEMTT